MKKYTKADYLRFIEDIAEQATRAELFDDLEALVPTYQSRSEELDALIIKARDFLAGIED